MIEQVKQTEYDTILNECRIKIGGTCEKFVPNINASMWDDEAWLNINCPVSIDAEKETFKDGKIEIGVKDEKHRFFKVDDKLEYEIEYSKRPADQVAFDLTFPEGMRFVKQKTVYEDWLDEQARNPGNPNNLTWPQYRDAAHRPENVVGSFAIFWKKKNNKYKSGKWGHIYRIGLKDAGGKTAWAESDIIPIDKTHARLVATMPTEFFDDAHYPVTLDPILGNNVQGASNWGYNNIKDTIWDVTDGSGGAINTYYCQLESVAANTDVKMGVYDCEQVAYDPKDEALLEQALIQNVSIGENSVAGGSTVLSASTYYNIAWIPESSDTDVYYDSDGNCGYYTSGRTYGDELSNPYSGSSTIHNRHYTIWVDYGGGGGGISMPLVMLQHDHFSGGKML